MIQLRAVYLSNEDVEGAFSNVSEALENLKPEAFNAMIDADIFSFIAEGQDAMKEVA